MAIKELAESFAAADLAIRARFDRDAERIAELEAEIERDATRIVRMEDALHTIKHELAALTPTPDAGATLEAWEALCPRNAADRECLRLAWVTVTDALMEGGK